MTQLLDLGSLGHAEKDVLILALWEQVQKLSARVAELEVKLGGPPKAPENPSVPPSQARKANKATNKHGKRLTKRYGKDRDSLFTFMTECAVPPTNNASERDIQPSTVLRNVTGGFRSDWASGFHAAILSTRNTGRRHDLSAFQAIQTALDGDPVLRPG